MADLKIKASLVKIDGKAALQIDPIMLPKIANVKPEADGTVHRATVLYLSNRDRVDGETVIRPIKGLKAEAPFLSVTLSLDVESARDLGFGFNVKEAAKPKAAKRTGLSMAELSRKPSAVTTRPLADGE